MSLGRISVLLATISLALVPCIADQVDALSFPHLERGFTTALDLPPWGRAAGDDTRNALRDAEKFQAWIHARQHPTNCQNARIYDMAAHPYGFGSQLHVHASSLLEALAGGYVFLSQWQSHYINQHRCPSQTMDCLFLPFTQCTTAHALAAKARSPPQLKCSDNVVNYNPARDGENQENTTGRFLDCQYANRKTDAPYTSQWWFEHSPYRAREGLETLRQLAQLEGDYGVAFYNREAIRYITRPNEGLIRFVRQLRRDIPGMPSDMSAVVGVHVRRGDGAVQRNSRWEAADYVEAFQTMSVNHGHMTHLMLSSDDKTAYAHVEAVLKKVNVHNAQLIRHVVPYPPHGHRPQIVHIPLHYWRIMNGDQKTMPAAAQIRAAYRVANHSQEWDEAMLLTAQTFLFANCGGFIGTMDSNIARLVWEFMSAVTGTFNPNVFDMNGGMWYAGWEASPHPYRHLHHHYRHQHGKPGRKLLRAQNNER